MHTTCILQNTVELTHSCNFRRQGTLGNVILLKEQATDSSMHLTLILETTHTCITTPNQQDRHKVSNTKHREEALNGEVLLSRFSTSEYSFYKLRKLNVNQV